MRYVNSPDQFAVHCRSSSVTYWLYVWNPGRRILGVVVLVCLFAVPQQLQAGELSKLDDTTYIRTRIDMAESFFRSIGFAQAEVDVRILSPYIERRFGRDLRLADTGTTGLNIPLVYRSFWVYEQPGEFFAGLTRPQADSVYDQLYTDYYEDRTDAYTAFACLCREVELPDDFFLKLDQRMNWGVYELTHGALQYRNLYENGCIPQAQFDLARARTETRLKTTLTADVQGVNPDDDMLMESALMLYYLGSPLTDDLQVRKKVLYLVEKQDINGGWSRLSPGISSQHTTLLAWWLLLEIQNRIAQRY